MADDKQPAFDYIKKLIEEGKIKIPDNKTLFDTLFANRDKTRKPVFLVPKPIVGADPEFPESPPLVLYFTKEGYASIEGVSSLFVEEIKEVERDIWNKMDAKMKADYLFGVRPEELPMVTTTASSKPLPSLNLDTLKEMIKDLQDCDPLLKNGIQKDWVCVIRPRMVPMVQDFLKKHPYIQTLSPQGELNTYFGRSTYIINEATQDVDYMPKGEMYAKYAEHFLRELEAMKRMQKEDEEGQ